MNKYHQHIIGFKTNAKYFGSEEFIELSMKK